VRCLYDWRNWKRTESPRSSHAKENGRPFQYYRPDSIRYSHQMSSIHLASKFYPVFIKSATSL